MHGLFPKLLGLSSVNMAVGWPIYDQLEIFIRRFLSDVVRVLFPLMQLQLLQSAKVDNDLWRGQRWQCRVILLLEYSRSSVLSLGSAGICLQRSRRGVCEGVKRCYELLCLKQKERHI